MKTLPPEDSYRGFPGASYANALLYNLHHPEGICRDGILKSAKELGLPLELAEKIAERAAKPTK